MSPAETPTGLARGVPWLLWVLALGLIVATIVLSHHWKPAAGIEPLYVVLALVVLALPLPPVREFLGDATNVELAGVKITRQIAQDAEELSDDVPVLNIAFEEEGRSSSDGDLRVIGQVWATVICLSRFPCLDSFREARKSQVQSSRPD